MRDSHRNLHSVPNPEPTTIEVIEPGAVSMTEDQYTSAVKALAVLINQWRANQARDGTGDADRPWAA